MQKPSIEPGPHLQEKKALTQANEQAGGHGSDPKPKPIPNPASKSRMQEKKALKQANEQQHGTGLDPQGGYLPVSEEDQQGLPEHQQEHDPAAAEQAVPEGAAVQGVLDGALPPQQVVMQKQHCCQSSTAKLAKCILTALPSMLRRLPHARLSARGVRPTTLMLSHHQVVQCFCLQHEGEACMWASCTLSGSAGTF